MRTRLLLLILAVTLTAAWPALAKEKGKAQKDAGKAEPEELYKPPLPPQDREGLATGYRGVTLSMSGYQLAFVNKGDFVDVMVTFDAMLSDKRKEKVTATILQNVLVVNVQKPAKLDERGAVEFLLNPNETQYASLSYFQGELSLARRAEGDHAMKPMEMASLRKLFK